jgi:hypothetical protein
MEKDPKIDLVLIGLVAGYYERIQCIQFYYMRKHLN